MKRVFIIHGWGATPKDDFYPWLRKELEDNGFQVHAPHMEWFATINGWVSQIESEVKELQSSDIFIGHSMGAQAILRYFETLTKGKASGAVLVSPFVNKMHGKYYGENPTDEDIKELNQWIETPISWADAAKRANKFITIFSDDDPFIRVKETALILEKELTAQTIIRHGYKHFTTADGVKEVPIVLDAVLSLSKSKSKR